MGSLLWVSSALLLCISSIHADSLYDASDPILELYTDTFDTAVYGQKRAFFVEFYSSWCGACIGYAPTFKKFARQLASWKDVVQVSVVNCADDKNMPLCRTHSINSFPTLKYFKYMSSSKDDGELYNGDKHNLATLPLDVAALAQKDYDTQKPQEWPSFQALPDSTSLDDVWKTTQTRYVGVMVETDPAKVAWAEIINFHNDRHVRAVLVGDQHPIATRLALSTGQFVLMERGSSSSVWTSASGATWTDIQEKINEVISAAPAVRDVAPAPSIVAPIVHDLSQFQVQSADLQSALGYMLTKEVVRREVIDGENLSALKSWINVLKKYAPGTTPTRRLLNRLDEWIQLKMGQVTAEEWTNKVQEIQTDLGNPLPTTPTWLACKGTKSNLRGYTCGLWTLAHAITVQAYNQEKDNAAFSPVNDVLEPWHQFIVRFLSCKECAENFDKESAAHGLALVSRREDVVMWLWKVHNSVNTRIAGSASEDPKYPKQQFPPRALCQHCHKEDGSLDENESFKFVLSYYADIRTDPAEPAPAYKMSEFEDGKLQKAANRRLNPKFAVHADKVDKLEAAEAKLKKEQLDTNPQREWKDLDGLGSSFDASSESRGHFYVIWLSIIGVILIIAYCNYRRNRSKFWKQFYYHSDFKLPWTQGGHRKEYLA